MASQHSIQTHPKEKHLWRFLAIHRSDLSARPCRLSVEASTEHEARRVLAPYFILSLAARLPVRYGDITIPSRHEGVPPAQGVCNA